MKKIALIALAAASLGAMAAPAAAQSYDRYDRQDRQEYDRREYDRSDRREYDRHDRRDRVDNGRWDYRHDWDRGFNINQMQNQLDRRIDRGIQRGLLTREEARTMRTQFRDIVRLEARYRNNGLNRYERNELERHLVAFERRLDKNLRDGQYYANRR